MGFKVLHTSDWHLGSRFLRFDRSDALKLSRARLDAVESVLAMAQSFAVDAVLCAGDLFDSMQPADEWWKGLLEKLSKHPNTGPVFLLPGNHDPITPTSVYDPDHPFRKGLPDWVHVVDRPDFYWEFGQQAVVYGVPCTSQAGENDPLEKLPFREPGDERIRLALAHGQTLDIPGHSNPFPVRPERGVERGFDYVALGDYHSRMEVKTGGPTAIHYCGSPEATKFGEEEAGYVALVYLRRGGLAPQVRHQRTGRWLWRREVCSSVEGLQRLMTTEDLRQTVLHLTLGMELPLLMYEEVERLIEELRGTSASHGRVGVLVLDRERLRISTENFEQAFEALPEALQQVAQALAQRPGPTARRALFHFHKLTQGGGI